MAVTLIFKESRPHRPSIAVATSRNDDGTRRSFVVANLSGKYLSDSDAKTLAQEKADKNGFEPQEVVVRDMETHTVINED